MLSLDQQEAYRQRYARVRPGWRPSSHVYQDMVTAHLTPAAQVLDLGCGRGGVMERLHPRAGFVAGIDPDPSSLREHRAPALARVCGWASALPYADATFDLVCCSWALEHLPDPAQTLAEVARVLVPGGHFVFLTPNARHPLLMLNRALGWTRGRLVGRFYDRAEADTFPAFYRANTPAQIERLAQAAGLKRVSLRLIGDPTYLAFNEPLFRLACLLERVTPRWMQVHMVGEYVARRRQALCERLQAGYLADAALDREMAEEWRPLEEETWTRYVATPLPPSPNPPGSAPAPRR